VCSLIKLILSDAEYDINRKTGEVIGARNALHTFRNVCKSAFSNGNRSLCTHCAFRTAVDQYKVEVYVRPLPNVNISQFAIAFELLAPGEIVCLRDILTLVRSEFCQATESDASKVARDWPWTEFWQICDRQDREVCPTHFQLGSTRMLKRMHQSPEFRTNDDFIFTNMQNCTYFGYYEDTCDVKKWCVLSVEPKSLYAKARLQWTLESTSHNENQVIARLSHCPGKMRLEEFKTFGSLRAGHRLQLRNILHALVTKSLSFKEESVLVLIGQSIWEAGP